MGFRPGRGAHDALDALAYGIERRKVNWIADADIRAFFDQLDRGWLIKFVEHRIGDRRVIRLISRMPGAGVMEEGEWRDTLRGVPQGSSISPILATIYLHFVLDLWFQGKWRARIARGETIIVRYADDFVVGFQYKRDAERFLCDLKDRLADFLPELHPGKTRLIEFGKFAMANRRARGEAACRDVRLPRVHALLPDHAQGTFRTGAQADREAGQPDPEAHQGRTAQANASQHPRGRQMAWTGRGRMATVLRGANQLPVPQQVCASPHEDVAACPAATFAEGSLYMEQGRQTGGGLLASAADSAPMADHEICRQDPR